MAKGVTKARNPTYRPHARGTHGVRACAFHTLRIPLLREREGVGPLTELECPF